jgi:hypothetical protein
MEPKKDVSTAILDQKKAPNKLLVLPILSRLKKPTMMRIPPFNSVSPKWQNSKFSKEMPFSSKARSAKKP